MTYRRHSNLKAGAFSRTSITGAGNVIKRPINPSEMDKKVVPPPDDGFVYVASGGPAGSGYWLGPFYLKAVVLNGTPTGKTTLEMNTDDATTYPMFEGQE